MGRLLRRCGLYGESAGARLPALPTFSGKARAPAPRRRLAVLGAVAGLAIGLVLQAQAPALALTRMAAVGSGTTTRSPGSTGVTSTGATSTGVTSTGPSGSTFGQITLPDLLIVAPKGLTAAQITSLGAIPGLRDMITFDGAQIQAGGVPVSVIGVNPTTLRSWVPLQAASDQAFWSALAGGDFVAQTAASAALRLKPGAQYQLTGDSTQVVRFGLAAALGLTGIDLLVNQSLSARLGLVRQVAGLVSAPGVAITTLRAEVAQILGPSGRIEVLRSQQLPVAVPAGTQPATYLELFKASAARFCPGLSWTVLAAIGQIESGDGQNMGPSTAGALGPMQFLPSTWQEWGVDAFGQTGPPDVMNAFDAVPSAARMLCADGAGEGGAALADAIFDYNHADWYVTEVLALAAQYAADYQ
ncbi:MAG: lytic transglycosylase domain-containing protein [Streptosporangiaceae bacterium]